MPTDARPRPLRPLATVALALGALGCPGFRTGSADVPQGEPSADAPGARDDADRDAATDAPALDAPALDAPALDALAFDALASDALAFDAPLADLAASDRVDAPSDGPAVDVVVDRVAPPDASSPTPRPLGPPVGSVVTFPRPSLHWQVTGALIGAAVEVCRDRACSIVESAFDALGASGMVTADLSSGAHFWRLRGLTGTGRVDAWSPTWEFWISPLRPPRESVYGAVLDLDGDGESDLAIGAPGAEGGSGRVFVWRGPLSAPPGTLVLSPANEATVGFGHVVVNVGDVDGDGFTDLGVASYDPAESQGTVEIFRGNGAFAMVRGRYLSTPGDRTFGFSLDGAGDTNGDGYADVIVGQPGAADDRGRAHVYLGAAGGPGVAPALTLRGRDVIGARFGYAVAGSADIDNDGFADVVVSGPGAPVGQGGAYAYRGSSDGLSVASINRLVTDGDPVGRHGAVVAHVGDINDDGFSDFAVGSPGDGTTGGRVLLHLGTGVGLDPSAITLAAPSIPTQFFGAAVAGVGDLDGDGVGDLAIGATAAGFAGRVTVVYGARTATPSLRRATLDGLTADSGFGGVIASVDLLGGTFMVGVPLTSSAARYVPSGATLPRTPAFVFDVPMQPRFGHSIAGLW